MRQFMQQMKDKQNLDGTSLSVTYHKILTKELNEITDLQANEDTKKDMYGATGYQILNIVETSVEPTVSQCDEQDEYNVHYGTNSASNNMVHKSKQKLVNQPKQKHQTPNPNKIKILTRDQFDPNKQTSKSELTMHVM